ncbi:transporter substrate-binding domain-containing protein [Paraglaciecola sp. L3A3]|uniref:transporter substrate-binding domain-containing protein n=1 Tax=Paraglaciecola sp. L3A3 TaxID=2686358 RepID=UPI00131C7271|nr:transporter substrate-binding domain-containing protein [Paraglaciecola sp. L3A3]
MASAVISPITPAKERYIQLSQVHNASKNDCAYKNLMQAYTSIGYQLEFLILPAKRALVESNAGYTDGETARVQGLETSYPNLVRIPVAICHMKQNLYALKSNETIRHAPIKNLKLGILNGGFYVEKKYTQYNPIRAINNEQLFNLLMKGRVDAVVMSPSVLKKVSNKKEIDLLFKIEKFTPTVPLFHYLHKKHKPLIPQITKALQELEKLGFVAEAIKNHQK